MAKSAIVRWSDPELILVATNLLEGQNLLLHAMYQARLSRSPVLLVHVIRPSRLKSDYPEGAPSFLPSSAVQFVRATLDESVKDFRREGILCEPIVLAGSPAEQVRLLVNGVRWTESSLPRGTHLGSSALWSRLLPRS